MIKSFLIFLQNFIGEFQKLFHGILFIRLMLSCAGFEQPHTIYVTVMNILVGFLSKINVKRQIYFI